MIVDAELYLSSAEDLPAGQFVQALVELAETGVLVNGSLVNATVVYRNSTGG